MWFRTVGLVLLLASFFLPLPPALLLGILAAGLALFLVGALAWIAKDDEPWLRR